MRQAGPAMEKASGAIFFEKPCNNDGHGQQRRICVRAPKDEGESVDGG
jgi:hypothetical protein